MCGQSANSLSDSISRRSHKPSMTRIVREIISFTDEFSWLRDLIDSNNSCLAHIIGGASSFKQIGECLRLCYLEVIGQVSSLKVV